jgi:DNA repair exonuclease SbcCD ATPase subunit
MPKEDIVDQSENADILEDLLLPDDSVDNDDTAFDPKEMTALKDQLSEKDKQINGLLNTVKTDRRKRQEYKGQLDALTGTVNGILTQKEQADKILAEASSKDDRIVVDVTDDGDAFIPREKLDATVAPLQQQVDDLEAQLNETKKQQASARDSEQLIHSLVGEDERYGSVYNKYQSARKWVNDKVVDFQQDNNIRGQLSSGQALTHVFNDEMINEFKSLYPEMDLASVTTAEDSTWHFKQMLQTTADKFDTVHTPDERFRRVVNKPSTLGKSSNAKAGEIPLTERVSKMSATDIMKLTDAQVEALQNYMSDDEQKGGIDF